MRGTVDLKALKNGADGFLEAVFHWWLKVLERSSLKLSLGHKSRRFTVPSSALSKFPFFEDGLSRTLPAGDRGRPS